MQTLVTKDVDEEGDMGMLRAYIWPRICAQRSVWYCRCISDHVPKLLTGRC